MDIASILGAIIGAGSLTGLPWFVVIYVFAWVANRRRLSLVGYIVGAVAATVLSGIVYFPFAALLPYEDANPFVLFINPLIINLGFMYFLYKYFGVDNSSGETEPAQNANAGQMRTHESDDFRFRKAEEDTLHFKDTASAFEFCCRFERNELRENVGVPAIVLDARKLLGADDAVPIDEDGIQRAYLRVASDDGGFEVVGHAMSQNGPRLDAGDFVIWVPLKYIPKLGKGLKDRRGGWAGAIIARLRPVRSHENGWAIDERFGS